MSSGHRGGNIVPAITVEEHDSDLYAKRTSLASAATIYAVVNTGGGAGSQVTVTPYGLVTLGASPNFIGLTTIVRAITPFNQFGVQSIVSNSIETTLVTYTVPTGNTAYIQGFLVASPVSGLYNLKVASTVSAMLKTSAAATSLPVNFQDGAVSASAAQSVTVTVQHNDTLATHEISANIYGYLIV